MSAHIKTQNSIQGTKQRALHAKVSGFPWSFTQSCISGMCWVVWQVLTTTLIILKILRGDYSIEWRNHSQYWLTIRKPLYQYFVDLHIPKHSTCNCCKLVSLKTSTIIKHLVITDWFPLIIFKEPHATWVWCWTAIKANVQAFTRICI